MEQSPSWEANRFSASQQYSAFYGTWKFSTALTSAHQPSLTWAHLCDMIQKNNCTSNSLYLHNYICRNKYIFMSVPFNCDNRKTLNQNTCSSLCEYSKGLLLHVKKRGTLHKCKQWRCMAEAQVQLHSFLTLAGDGGDWSTPFPSHFTIEERTPGCVDPTATLISALYQ